MSKVNSKRIAKNTGLLYAKMAIVMVVNLYTVRLVLNALGVVDYGIYDVVAGIVIMFQHLSSVLTISNQRYYSYSLGAGDDKSVSQVFSSSINVNVIFSLSVILICETVGLWFLNTHLDIPETRITAANWLYQFSVLSFVAALMQIPFSSAVIANENMGIFAGISLLSCFLRLFTAIYISNTNYDRLIIYGLLLALISLIELIVYTIIALRKYGDLTYHRHNATIWRELLSFSGWTLFGSVASIGMTQFCTFLVNIFFGPVVNAARAISFQINNAINSFSSSFLTAVRPPMIKSYAEKNYDYLNTLFNYSTKFVFYTLLIVFLPLYLEMEYVLDLWLKTTDVQTVLFCRLMLIYSLILSLNNPITFIMQAGGFVKQYHVSVEIPTLATMPVTYFLFKIGCPASSTYYTMIAAVVVSHIVRMVCLRRYYPQYNIYGYLKYFVLRAILILSVAALALYYVQSMMYSGIMRLLSINILSVAIVGGLTYTVGLIKEERFIVKSAALKFLVYFFNQDK